MKDVVVCDKFVKEIGVFCFEMEVVGLMNYFLCFIICGICDYFDLYKSKQW